MTLHPAFARALAASAAVLFAASSAGASTFDVNLGFASLPSAQGWTYTPSGSHAGVLESSVFSVAGGVLTQNTMGQSNGVSGGSIFYVQSPGVTTGEPKQIILRGRCLVEEGSANATLGQGGFFFGFTTGSTQYGFGFTSARAYVLQPGGTVVLTGTMDNATAFHDWLFDWTTAASWRLYRDGILLGAFSGGFAVAANRLFFGDGTGGANAHGEITRLEFVQGAAVPAQATTWGRVKGLYR